jgi:hypothetical protein
MSFLHQPRIVSILLYSRALILNFMPAWFIFRRDLFFTTGKAKNAVKYKCNIIAVLHQTHICHLVYSQQISMLWCGIHVRADAGTFAISINAAIASFQFANNLQIKYEMPRVTWSGGRGTARH